MTEVLDPPTIVEISIVTPLATCKYIRKVALYRAKSFRDYGLQFPFLAVVSYDWIKVDLALE
jgi:hypothetical protein